MQSTGVIAVAVPARLPPSAEAGKHRKPPLVFVSARVTGIIVNTVTAFDYTIGYPSKGRKSQFTFKHTIVSNVTPAQLRGAIVADVKNFVDNDLLNNGLAAVPFDRISVALL